MTKQPPSISDSTLARGGGNAAAAGMNFEANLGAWFAAHLLGERSLPPALTGRSIRSLRFETEAPVDDILVETTDGWLFVQAKTSLSLSSISTGALGKVVEQFVRQWFASSTGDGARGWNRPLQSDRDRLVLALGPGASQTVTTDLAEALAALQTHGNSPLSQAKQEAVEKFRTLIGEAWKAAIGAAPNTSDVDSILRLVTIMTFDFAGGDRHATLEILNQAIERPTEASPANAVVVHLCHQLMAQRTGCDMATLRGALTSAGVPLAAPPSYRDDVAALRTYSDQVERQLSRYESTSVSGTQIRIDRPCTDAVVEAARAGSLLLVGEPGAGKSAVINAAAAKLRAAGHDVIELAVDRLPVGSLSDLARELGIPQHLNRAGFAGGSNS